MSIRKQPSKRTCAIASAVAFASAILSACAESPADADSIGGGGTTNTDPDDGQGGQGGASEGSPRYAVMYEVYDDVGSTSYLALLDSLEAREIDVSKVREFGGGRAFLQSYKGWIFVGDAASPRVTRYSLSDRGELTQDKMCSADNEDCQISFSNFGLSSGQFDSWNVTFINEEKAYLLSTNDGTTIIWNPTTMEIVGDIPPAAEFDREGLSLETTPAALRDNLLFRTFNWVNYDDATYSTDMLFAVYDVEKDALIELVTETRCPVFGNLVHTDEAGTIYFSNWIWPVAGTLMRNAPATCVLRINPGETRFDPDWQFDYTSVTDGRQGAMFSYLADGKALISVFYDERTSFDETTSAWSYVGGQDWRIWSVDLETNATSVLEEIDFNGGAFTPVRSDEGLVLMVPGGEAESYATQLYVVDGTRAKPSVKLPGWSYQMVRLD